MGKHAVILPWKIRAILEKDNEFLRNKIKISPEYY